MFIVWPLMLWALMLWALMLGTAISKFSTTTLVPTNNPIYVCPRKWTSFICNDTSSSNLKWKLGEKFEKRYFRSSDIYNPTTLYSDSDVEVNSTLLRFEPPFVMSTLQVSLSENISSISLYCNQEMRTINISDCVQTLLNVRIKRFQIFRNDSTLLFMWDMYNSNSPIVYYSTMSQECQNTTQNYIHFSVNSINFTSINFFTLCGRTKCSWARINITSAVDKPLNINEAVFEANIGYLGHYNNCNTTETGMEYCEWIWIYNTTNNISTTLPATSSGQDSSTVAGSVTLRESSTNGTKGILSPSSNSIAIVAALICIIVVVIIVVTCIAIFIATLKKRQPHKKECGEDNTIDNGKLSSHQDEEQYDRINFCSKATGYECEDYSTLNTEQYFNKNIIHSKPNKEDEYSTLNNKRTVVADDYEYTSVRFQPPKNIGKTKLKSQNQPTQYSEMEDSDLSISVSQTTVHPADKLLNLDTLLIQLRELAHMWESLGKSLNYTRKQLNTIRSKSKEDFNCLVELCDSWIRDQTSPTWKTIANALKDIGELQLHSEILQIYETGELPDRPMQQTEEEVTGPPPPIPPQLF